MPLVPAPDLPTTLYGEVASVGTDGRGRDVAYLVLLKPGDGLTDTAVAEIAHRFIMVNARLAWRGGKVIGEIVESAVAPPGNLNWHGLEAAEGTWVAAIRVTDEETGHALASTRRVVLHPVVERDAAKRGGTMDERTLSKVLQAALQPVIDAMARAEVRLKQLEEAVRSDPFGDAVRGRGDAGRQVLERLKRLQRERDPVGAAISERRPPVVPSRPALGALAHDAPDEAPPPDPADPDPVGTEIRRKRPPSVRPVGVSLRVKR
jgi:hypothetical protein